MFAFIPGTSCFLDRTLLQFLFIVYLCKKNIRCNGAQQLVGNNAYFKATQKTLYVSYLRKAGGCQTLSPLFEAVGGFPLRLMTVVERKEG